MLGGLAAYLLNFLAGKNKNHKLAQSWLAAHRQLLEENFSVIGWCCNLLIFFSFSVMHKSSELRNVEHALVVSSEPFIG